MEMSTVKTVAVFIIIFGCFAVLYPKIFHPIFTHVFTGGAPKQQTNDDVLNRIPPHLRHGRPMGTPEDSVRQMRAGSHPGLRAAAEMKKQAAQSSPGGGKGMMSIVLPMYAVGIVVYLVYTLSKVFGKDKEKPPGEDYLTNDPFKDVSYDQEKHTFHHRTEDDDDDAVDPETKAFRKSKAKKKDLENLLLKADDRTITEIEMRQLKDRLMETETQMNRILKAMETVHRQVGQTAEDHLSHQARAAMDELQKSKSPTDLSPDMDSYDIISGSSSPIEIGPMNLSKQTSKIVRPPENVAKAAAKNSLDTIDLKDSGEEDDRSTEEEQIESEEEEYVAEEEYMEEEEEEGEEEQQLTSEEEIEENIDTKEESSEDQVVKEQHPDLRMRKTAENRPKDTGKRKDETCTKTN